MHGPGDVNVSVAEDEIGSDETPDEDHVDALRAKVLAHLTDLGFSVTNGHVIAPVAGAKDDIRRLHDDAVRHQRQKAEGALARDEEKCVARLTRGAELDVNAIRPRLVPIGDRRSFESRLWRWVALHWSVPVSAGYGRRIRYLVVDEGHDNAIMGVIGLGDPVFALGARDQWIGWDRDTRGARLTNVMDCFVLGAAAPYNALLGGKLVALLATSTTVRDDFAAKYGHRTSLITGRDPNANLALVTTTSALGRSSVYNRLTKPTGALAYKPLGFTLGSGDFHLAGSLYDELADFVSQTNIEGRTHLNPRWRAGTSRNRREVIQFALVRLGLNPHALRYHGIRREAFAAPLMSNTSEYLRGEDLEPDWSCHTQDEVSAYWLSRWGLPRSRRDETWRTFEPDLWRLYSSPADGPAQVCQSSNVG